MSNVATPRRQHLACPFHAASLLDLFPGVHYPNCDRLGFADMSHVHEHLRHEHYIYMSQDERMAMRELFNQSNQRMPKRTKWYKMFAIFFPGAVAPASPYHLLLSDFLNAHPELRGYLYLNSLLPVDESGL